MYSRKNIFKWIPKKKQMAVRLNRKQVFTQGISSLEENSPTLLLHFLQETTWL